MKSINPDNITVIVRSIGERTASLCYHLVAQQVPEKNIVTISERPFITALVRSYEVGIDRGLPWTLCVDGDVLLHSKAVGELLSVAKQVESNTFELQGKVLDKFFGFPRPAGNHLYRTALLAEALKYTQLAADTLRPENFVIKQMACHGYGWQQRSMIVGLHDYEQYYRDIYRTVFVHARKHGLWTPYFEALWQRLAEKDSDYEIALWGLHAGLVCDRGLNFDMLAFSREKVTSFLQMRGWCEKDDLSAAGFSTSEVDHLINTFKFPPEHQHYRRLIKVYSDGLSSTRSLPTQISRLSKKIGWRKTVPWLLGRGLGHLGRTIQLWAEH